MHDFRYQPERRAAEGDQYGDSRSKGKERKMIRYFFSQGDQQMVSVDLEHIRIILISVPGSDLLFPLRFIRNTESVFPIEYNE